MNSAFDRWILLTLISLFSVFTAPAGATESLRVLTEHLPPYQIVSGGKLSGGTSFLLVKELLQRSGYQAEVEVLPWARAYNIAITEDNVLIFSISRSEGGKINLNG